jgi:uncharacterized protein YndB with AHSA1/START domain
MTHQERRGEQMPHAEFSVAIRRPPADVFRYLADGMNNREWRSGVLEIERTTTTSGVGAAYRQVLAGPGGHRIDGDYRITVCEPPRQLEFLVTAGPARPTGSFQLTPDGGQGTVVRFALDLQPTGLMKVMSPMISRQMRREVAQLDRLREILESK